MKKINLLLLLTIVFVSSTIAQTASYANLRKFSKGGFDVINEGSEVKGYYVFYVSDKVDKKTNEYTLQIMDANLKQIKDVVFTGDKNLQILENSFNGKEIVFLVYNDKDRLMEYQIYGTDGKKKFSYERELSKKERRYLDQTYFSKENDEGQYKGLYPINGKGFISNMPSREDKDFTYQLDFFGSDQKKQWTYNPTEGAKVFIGDFLGEMNNVVYVEELRLKSRTDGKPDSYLIGLDLLTGKKLFEKETKGKEQLYPVSASIINGKPYVYGEYFGENENLMKGNSNGYGFWEVDEKGKVISEKYLSWQDEFSKFLDIKSNGKIDDFGFIYLHQMVQTADGKIFAVGEGFKRVASALGIAGAILGGGRSNLSVTKVKITDMMILEFDANLKLKNATIYPKKSFSFELPSGYEFVSLPIIAKIIKYTVGGFDYEYTQTNTSKTSFSTFYGDFTKGKDYKGPTFNGITYKDGKLTTNTINTKSEASWSRILPAKQGSVLFVEYFKKKKTLELHVEKIN
jgi:hypothetical protein